MKKNLPLILTVTGAAYLFFWLRRKAQAGANLQYIPLDIAIDTQRSSIFRIFYSVKLRLINNESANVNIKRINLKAAINGRFVGDIINTTSFQVPAKGTKDIKLDTSISLGSAALLIFNAIQDGLNFAVNITGNIDTDLGRINIDFTKNIGQGGISGPVILAGDKFTLRYKKQLQPVGRNIKEVYKYIVNSLNTGSKISDFTVTSQNGVEIPGAIFFDQAQNAPYDFADYTKN